MPKNKYNQRASIIDNELSSNLPKRNILNSLNHVDMSSQKLVESPKSLQKSNINNSKKEIRLINNELTGVNPTRADNHESKNCSPKVNIKSNFSNSEKKITKIPLEKKKMITQVTSNDFDDDNETNEIKKKKKETSHFQFNIEIAI
jgi:hypothetical protein